jgi:hypothetical protein
VNEELGQKDAGNNGASDTDRANDHTPDRHSDADRDRSDGEAFEQESTDVLPRLEGTFLFGIDR